MLSLKEKLDKDILRTLKDSVASYLGIRKLIAKINMQGQRAVTSDKVILGLSGSAMEKKTVFQEASLKYTIVLNCRKHTQKKPKRLSVCSSL